MKVLVTGCMGFIGSNAVPVILNQGHKVIGLDNLSNPSINPTDRMKKNSAINDWANFKFFKADITSPRELEMIFSTENIDCVVHLAAVGSVPRSFANPYGTVSSNDVGFVNLLQTMARFGCKQLVYASSSSVYGDNQETIKVEGYEGFPLSPYALTKRFNELFANMWAKSAGINAVGLRFFNVYGPGQLVNSAYSAVIPRFINTTPTLYGNGETIRDFTFVSDVATAILESIYFSRTRSGLFNIGTGQGTTLRDLLVLLGKTATQKPERPGDIKTSIASTIHAENTLGFKTKVKIAEGLDKTKRFYESELNNGGQSQF